MNPPSDPALIGSWIVTIVVSVGLALEKLKSRKKEKRTEQEDALVSDAKMFEARGTLLRKLADDNLELYKTEHTAHEATRKYWHDKANEFQTTLAMCQEKLAESQAKPDYSDLITFIKQQADTSVQILKGIEKILQVIEHVISDTKIEVVRQSNIP